MKKIILLTSALLAASATCAEPILFNIIDRKTPVNASIEDFTAAGVTEDLSDAALSNVRGLTIAEESMIGTNNVSLSFEQDVIGPYNNPEILTGAGSNLLQNYISLRDNSTSVTATIAGLSSELTPNTHYVLYLWGIGDKGMQNSKFTHDNSAPITVSAARPSNQDASSYMAKFSFKTGNIVEDTLSFEWDRSGESSYGGFNAFAIVPTHRASIPEPAAYTLIISILALGAVIVRRHA